MIQNPILKGFCPDPSIIRVGKDYYIATSTFEWWPGVRIFHSRDLQHWEQIPSPLTRTSQLNLQGDPCSGGVWAPCLTYDGSRFYLLFTDVKTKKGRFYNTHNYLVYTDDIYGQWSEPVYLNSIGFDPSLFHDTDGKKYLINMINGFKGILVQEIDPDSWQLVGERKLVYGGTDMRYTEGPHMYHIGDWYYLVVAEGGTGYDHGVTMARSKSIWGPFETAPNNPIITSNREDMGMLQKCGHGDFVDTPEGEWYMVHLCSRPVQDTNWCTLGRETAIQKMVWDEEGWLRMEQGGKFGQLTTPAPKGATECVYPDDSLGFRDDFDEGILNIRYSAPRADFREFTDLSARKGYLRMRGQESMNSWHKVSHLAVRQQAYTCVAETSMEFVPTYGEQMAGLSYAYDALCFYLLAKTCNDRGETVLVLLKSDGGVITDEMEPIPVSAEGEVQLQVEVLEEGRRCQFAYKVPGGDWQQAGERMSCELVTDEYARGFTGAHFGMYVHDMTGLGLYADFDYFSVECR